MVSDSEPTNVIQRIIKRLDDLEARVAKLERDRFGPVELPKQGTVKWKEEIDND
jgi:hypothetical protein